MTVRVKGAVIAARRAFVRREYGEEAWQRVVDSLDEEHRQALTGLLLSVNWYPFELNRRLDEAIVEVLGDGARSLFEAIGAGSARENLGGPHEHFLIQGDPQAFMAKADRIYDFYYDAGHRTWEPTGPRSGVMTTYEADTFSETDCLTVIGWYKEALAMCGASGVEVREVACRARGDEFCRYELSWSS